MIRFIVYILIAYIAFLLLLFLFQRHLVYFPAVETPKPSDWQVPDMQVVYLHTEDGLQLQSWYKPAKPNQPTLVYFHGNGSHLGARGFIVRPYLNAGFGVLLVSYRGYAGNPGKPTENGLYQDGRAALKFLQAQNILPSSIVLYGESLGSAVAVQMASEFQVGALVLWSPFTTLAEVGQHHYFYLPVKWLLKDKYDALTTIQKLHTPLLIIHSENDEITPASLARKLFTAANPPKEVLFLQNAGHNDHQDVSAAIMAFIKKVIY